MLTHLLDLREYDVPYVERGACMSLTNVVLLTCSLVCIDLGLRCGLWYTVTPSPGSKGSVLYPCVHTCANTRSRADMLTQSHGLEDGQNRQAAVEGYCLGY